MDIKLKCRLFRQTAPTHFDAQWKNHTTYSMLDMVFIYEST